MQLHMTKIIKRGTMTPSSYLYRLRLATIYVALCLMTACQSNEISLLNPEDFKSQIDGKDVQLYTLSNANGITMQVTNYGAKVMSLYVPDRNGKFDDIVTGFETIEETSTQMAYFGATIGRYANRIKEGLFTLDSVQYQLSTNNGSNHSHGGQKGFCNRVWQVDEVSNSHIKLTYLSPDGEEGYPGNLTVTCTYSLTDHNEFKIDYRASTDNPTIVNLTQHSFFNLKGAGKGQILDHLLEVNATSYLPTDHNSIPIGNYEKVLNTPFDFITPREIGDMIESGDEQLKYGKGYDHTFVLNKYDGLINYAAKLIEPLSGRVMEVYTNEPGLHVYSGNFLKNTMGKYGETYEYREAICLETQHFPNSPNEPTFPSTRLNPNEEYTSTTIYRFLTQ